MIAEDHYFQLSSRMYCTLMVLQAVFCEKDCREVRQRRGTKNATYSRGISCLSISTETLDHRTMLHGSVSYQRP